MYARHSINWEREEIILDDRYIACPVDEEIGGKKERKVERHVRLTWEVKR